MAAPGLDAVRILHLFSALLAIGAASGSKNGTFTTCSVSYTI